MELARPVVRGFRPTGRRSPPGIQTSFTGLCGVLLWAHTRQDRVEDQTIVLDAVNAVRPTSTP